MCSRNVLHCSYPNHSESLRVTLNWGFFPRAAVLGAKRGQPGWHADGYSEDRIRAACAVVPLAVAYRALRFPEEPAFENAPWATEERVVWENWAAHETILNAPGLGV